MGRALPPCESCPVVVSPAGRSSVSYYMHIHTIDRQNDKPSTVTLAAHIYALRSSIGGPNVHTMTKSILMHFSVYTANYYNDNI